MRRKSYKLGPSFSKTCWDHLNSLLNPKGIWVIGKFIQINCIFAYLQYRYGYDSQTSSVFAHNCKTHRLTYRTLKATRILSKIRKNNFGETYRAPFLSCFPSCWSISISIIAASRYFLMPRTILIATISLRSLSQHSKTWPKVPDQIDKKK